MNEPRVCAVTGATGYVGSLIVKALAPSSKIVPLVRRPAGDESLLWDFNADRDISGDLKSRGVDTLIHAAWDMRANSLEELRRSSVAGSERLFEMAARAGISRIVFISTISAFAGCRSAYGRSKIEVENLLRGTASVILRPGLVFGPSAGGAFGAIRGQVTKSKIVPLIGDGRAPQYLLHQQTLQEAIKRSVAGQLDGAGGAPITLAHPQPWPFRDLVSLIAAEENRQVTLVPVPWQLLYAGLKSAETLGVRAPVRSDSVISFIYQNPKPDFSLQQQYGINPLPFRAS